MSQQLIITTPANSQQGDSPKSAFDKINGNFTELYTGAITSPLSITGLPGQPVQFKLTDGQAPNTIWSVNVGVNAVGEFEIIDNTAGTTPFKIDTLGHITVASPPTSVTAVTINGSAVSTAGTPVFIIQQNSPNAGAGGLLIQTSVAQAASIGMRNTANLSTTFAELALQGGSGTDNISFLMTNPNWLANGFGISGLPAGQCGVLSSVPGTNGAFPLALVTNGTVQALIGATGGVTIAPTVAPPAGGSTACGIKASSAASLGIYFGTGAPTFAAAQGSIYSNTTGAAGARLYVNTNGATTWAPAASP